MDIVLKRLADRSTGIFGNITNNNGFSCVTLEHAYEEHNGVYIPKVLAGSYVCVKGNHQLGGMDHPFLTYEVTNVLGHSGILFHQGNYNDDSSGCILLGDTIQGDMITNSRATFEKFMQMQNGCDNFMLTVED